MSPQPARADFDRAHAPGLTVRELTPEDLTTAEREAFEGAMA